MRPSSSDLRERGAAAIDDREGSQRQIARRFRVSLSFVARLLRHRHQTDFLDPPPHGGGHRPALDEADLERLRQSVKDRPDVTLEELRQRLGVPCSLTSIWRALRTLDLPCKQKICVPARRATPRSRPNAGPTRRSGPISTRSAWSSSMRAGRRPR